MWRRALRLTAIVVVSVSLGYLIGSSGLGGGLSSSPTALSPFMVSNLSIEPAEAQSNEPVTITVTVTNTHHTWGIYSLALKINGQGEAQKQANVDAGGSQVVSFLVTRNDPGRYRVFINGLSSSFKVVAPTY